MRFKGKERTNSAGCLQLVPERDVFVYLFSRWTARTEIPEIANVGEMKICFVCVNIKLHLTGSDP